jgi:3-dehydroquinate synthase
MSTWEVSATRRASYRLSITRNVLHPRNGALAATLKRDGLGTYIVVVDATVDRLYGHRIREYFTAHRIAARFVAVPANESAKNMDTLLTILHAISATNIRRRSEPIVVIGGGVLTDVVGLAASLHRRGTPFIRIPTTLMGLVDAAIGVKGAINFDGFKNRLGAYHPAMHTLLDPTFLATLAADQIRSGLAEMIKVAVICDAPLFDLLEREADAILLNKDFVGADQDLILHRTIAATLAKLEPNLWDDQLERHLDFGHTFSPVIEMDSGLLHGESVAIDMALSAVLAHRRRFLSHSDLSRLLILLRRCGLPMLAPCSDVDFLWTALEESTRHRDGVQRCPLPRGIGEAVFVDDLSRVELAEAYRDLSFHCGALTAGSVGGGHDALRLPPPVR